MQIFYQKIIPLKMLYFSIFERMLKKYSSLFFNLWLMKSHVGFSFLQEMSKNRTSCKLLAFNQAKKGSERGVDSFQ